MARWVAEETIEEIEVQVTMLVPLKKVTVEDKHLRSPGGHKPMRRTYEYVPTPVCCHVSGRLMWLDSMTRWPRTSTWTT